MQQLVHGTYYPQINKKTLRASTRAENRSVIQTNNYGTPTLPEYFKREKRESWNKLEAKVIKDPYYFTSTTKMPAINDLNFRDNWSAKGQKKKIF